MGERAPVLIAVDWGTSSLRAYLADAGARILERRESAAGILSVPVIDGRPDFARTLATVAGPWLARHGSLPVLLSGMIGSRQGWLEAPYVACPASLDEVAAALVSFAAEDVGRVHIVPGLLDERTNGPAGEAGDGTGAFPDVMRGEEAQIFGAALLLGHALDETVVLPGTHAKWARVVEGRIHGFQSFMTGEIFAALKNHTILGRLLTDEAGDASGFARGVRDGARPGPAGSLLHRVFAARTLGLLDRMPRRELADYLSGLLIGAEIAAGTGPVRRFTIVGGAALATRYAEAAALLALEARIAPADCVVAGHLAIARAGGLIGEPPP
jgi:2-dehydro-3-deoxygalactonokinase